MPAPSHQVRRSCSIVCTDMDRSPDRRRDHSESALASPAEWAVLAQGRDGQTGPMFARITSPPVLDLQWL
jgi:hypothetical protein